jgi:hypothetical protein
LKKLLKVLLVLVILVVALVVVAWLSLDGLVKAGVEKGGTSAMKVPTTLDTALVHIFGGEIVLDGLNIANPDGYTTAHLMKSGKIDVAVEIGSLTGSTVRVSKFVIDGLDVCIEQKSFGTSNVSVVMDNVKPAPGGGTETQKTETAKESSGKKILVDQILIKNVTGHVKLMPIPGRSSSAIDVVVPEIVLNNVSQDNAAGVAIPELMKKLVPAILMAVVKKGGSDGVIPAEFANALTGNIQDAVGSLGKGAGNLLNQTGNPVGNAARGLGNGLQGLFKK